jgi:hypothetical protein
MIKQHTELTSMRAKQWGLGRHLLSVIGLRDGEGPNAHAVGRLFTDVVCASVITHTHTHTHTSTSQVPASSICVFERSSRAGGRTFSLRSQGPKKDLVVELGAYRFCGVSRTHHCCHNHHLCRYLTATRRHHHCLIKKKVHSLNFLREVSDSNDCCRPLPLSNNHSRTATIFTVSIIPRHYRRPHHPMIALFTFSTLLAPLHTLSTRLALLTLHSLHSLFGALSPSLLG